MQNNETAHIQCTQGLIRGLLQAIGCHPLMPMESRSGSKEEHNKSEGLVCLIFQLQ